MPTIIERYPAIVTNAGDPRQRGRIKVKCIALTGEEDVEFPSWIEPTFDWGWFYVPDVGEEVEIEVVVHDDQAEDTKDQAFLEHPDPRWRNKRFRSDEGEQPRPPNDRFTARNYGKRRGFATPAGHVLMFDDTKGDEQVLLSWKKTGEAKYAFLSLDKDGSAILSNQKGSMIYLNAKDGQVMIADEHGNSYSSAESGLKLIDRFSNIVELKDGVVQVLSQGDVILNASSNVTVDAPKVVIDSGVVEVGSAADSPFVRYTDWLAYHDAHVHLTAFGPSGPPVPLAVTIPTIASTTATVKCTVWSVLIALLLLFWWMR
jgi:hypothetical protein